ncbi:amidohydrolase family protein [Roseateles asaccharophilus]|uniref:Imidazolonepropionase-like amidohydrolase n=1 Tax=Roseateles asaccharophilus TaxID=582607 RepID=A0ABU2ABP2_9BURK|nr:amidohydrolase family protein [Roseateles asaccharophilus]MDR7334018.1 imidazolonepropionase-like amidohydrolase [Roseateles asaccharophilus]
MKLPLITALLAATLAAHATPNTPPPPQREPLLLRNATLHPVSGPAITNGSLLIEAGRIKALGTNVTVPAGAQVVDLGGSHVYPGMVAANTSLGLVETRSVSATLDSNETGALNPNARALVAFNADSELLPVTRGGGVLAALAVPEAGRTGLVTGTSALLQLEGWNWQDMALRPEVALHITVPRLRLNGALFPTQPEARLADMRRTTEARLKLLDDTFDNARAYALARTADAATPIDTRWEAMRPVLPATPGAAPARPVFMHADDLAQIRFALDFAARHGLKLVIVGGADAWRVADTLRERQVPVIIAGLNRLPMRRDDAPDALFSLPARLAAAGVRWCIASGGRDSTNERNLPFEAAHARAFGLPDDEALKAVTLYPAQILGVADQLGSLEVGKLANLFVADGDPLEQSTRIERVFIQGREVELSDRQTKLRDKYLAR